MTNHIKTPTKKERKEQTNKEKQNPKQKQIKHT